MFTKFGNLLPQKQKEPSYMYKQTILTRYLKLNYKIIHIVTVRNLNNKYVDKDIYSIVQPYCEIDN